MGLKFGAALLGIVGLYFLNSTHALFPVPPLHEGAVPRDDEAEPDLLIWPPIPEKTMAVVKGKGVAVDLFAWFHRAPKFAGNHWYATPVPTVGTNAPPDSSATRTPRTDQAGSFEADRRTGRCSAADDGAWLRFHRKAAYARRRLWQLVEGQPKRIGIHADGRIPLVKGRAR
jgi:hypothetical protein